jgi:hypothetical protein
MHRFFASVACVVFAHVAGPALAELTQWDTLIDPEAQDYKDPFLDLSYEAIDDLVTIVRSTASLEDPGLSDADRATATQKLNEARARLAAEGHDADWLISQRWVVAERRKAAATATNPKISGAQVTLGGFAIPAPPAEDGTPIVYLVPERGMCSHVPPPNPNQMIRAKLNVDWSPSKLHQPVKLSGRLLSEETNESFHIVDGIVPMRSSFVMDVVEVETMPVFSSNVPDANAWATKLAEKARAAGQSTSEQEQK